MCNLCYSMKLMLSCYCFALMYVHSHSNVVFYYFHCLNWQMFTHVQFFFMLWPFSINLFSFACHSYRVSCVCLCYVSFVFLALFACFLPFASHSRHVFISSYFPISLNTSASLVLFIILNVFFVGISVEMHPKWNDNVHFQHQHFSDFSIVHNTCSHHILRVDVFSCIVPFRFTISNFLTSICPFWIADKNCFPCQLKCVNFYEKQIIVVLNPWITGFSSELMAIFHKKMKSLCIFNSVFSDSLDFVRCLHWCCDGQH